MFVLCKKFIFCVYPLHPLSPQLHGCVVTCKYLIPPSFLPCFLPSFLPSFPASAKYLIKKKETHQRFNKIILSRTLQQFLNKYKRNILFFYLIGFVLNIGSDFFMVFGKDFSISICCPCNSVMPRYSYTKLLV